MENAVRLGAASQGASERGPWGYVFKPGGSWRRQCPGRLTTRRPVVLFWMVTSQGADDQIVNNDTYWKRVEPHGRL